MKKNANIVCGVGSWRASQGEWRSGPHPDCDANFVEKMQNDASTVAVVAGADAATAAPNDAVIVCPHTKTGGGRADARGCHRLCRESHQSMSSFFMLQTVTQ